MPLQPLRQIHSHEINPANASITITVADEPGAGGANHLYVLEPQNGNPHTLEFQNGPINEVGVNGITHEALLAVLVDRLKGFQSGPYACRENAIALTKLEEAQMWLQQRTRQRIERGVEGTHAI
ncbi:Acb2/Tad1 domain-containing protein [Chitinimonas lacunae]|uniref:Acb2/Tad1 hairpin domain-containing protein n=1 Tax=Chitinimonas lacunae TaxID=1963018 RepID=A0ABV8MW41_9NEIS